MSNLVRFPGARRVKEEASGWLVRLDEGLAEDERNELAHWLEADPAHGEALVRMARLWDSMDSLAELAEIFPLDRYGSAHRPARRTLRAASVALAAIGVAALAGYTLIRGDAPPAATTAGVALPNPTAPDAGGASAAGATDVVSRSYRTAVGEQLSARLPDGSVITLNTDTLLEVAYSMDERLVVLARGEAIFRVAHNRLRPFRVRAGERIVQAVGTEFNVRITAADDIRVTVSEGRVSVRRPASRPASGGYAETDLTLDAGNVAVIGALGEEVAPIEPAQIEASLAWQRGMLIYRGETLDAVLTDMSRYTTARFTIADDSLRDRRVGGYFRAGDVDALLVALHESFGIEQRREGDMIVLTSGR